MLNWKMFHSAALFLQWNTNCLQVGDVNSKYKMNAKYVKYVVYLNKLVKKNEFLL